ncbi:MULTISPECIES: 3'-5' exonuclease [Pseudomonas]|uniref:3'-5' exonuclease n=1 Tax=Pseudomonas spirodelae TaxID=3101751 RepID=A0ABU5PA13_9PSED|nr:MULTISPECIES: 3'-5' exonuclease [unclassified Pseudomonas]MBU0808121.1 3'-5' exonuclease [Gammaproteobacteria bacterium]MBU0883472.1 3'-5' exonuclease [Gammaproteobacteria bacterium]MBU1859697.1 3'-5' exonuclease [Gammaproteobacteria bacterium]MDD2160987.1 3'-5' exonuclease [Pseudomonas sp. MIL19]MEA1606390.1 3'-5' exonuclease [Pseudomonas sp. T5W1]
MSTLAAPLDWAARFAELATSAKDPRLQAFYQAGCVAADTPLEQVPLLALDVETTGLDANQHAIVSLGLLPFNLQRIRCGEARYWVVKPASELSSESVTFHHITHSDIRHAPRLGQILDELLTVMAGKVMVVHYRSIERSFLDQAVREHLGEGLQFPVIDTMQLEARLHRQPNWWERLLRRQPVSIRLADSRLRYNLPPYQAHHALTDALATAELLQAQVATHYSADTPIGQLWS